MKWSSCTAKDGILSALKMKQFSRALFKEEKEYTLLQDAANATLRSETLRRNCVLCNNRKRWCKKLSKKVQNVCDDGCIKHGLDFSCVCDVGHMFQFN